MQYTYQELETLRDFYAGQLLNDTVPFWFPGRTTTIMAVSSSCGAPTAN